MKRRKDQSTVRLSVLSESPWCTYTGVIAKGLWVLVRSPPSSSDVDRVLAVAGRHDVMVSLRERSVPVAARNSPVWATIDRAGRMFAKSVVLKATRPIMLVMPLAFSCHAVNVSGSADRIIFSVSVRNSTADAYLSVMPPYINIGSSRMVNENDREGVYGSPVELDGLYEVTPLSIATDDDDASEPFTPSSAELSRQESDGRDDYGLLIPSFSSLQKHAVPLGPRETYNFSYMVVTKPVGTDTEELADGKSTESGSKLLNWKIPRGKCLRTNVAITWSCSLSKDGENSFGTVDNTFSREMSAAGVLAAGQRANVAVHAAFVDWHPPGLLEGVLVKLSGPRSATIGSTVPVSMTIMNQTDADLERVCVRLQQDGKRHGLLALRTVIVVGSICKGMETSLQLPCIPIESGRVGVGSIDVVAENEDSVTTWTSESEYQVLSFESMRKDVDTCEEVDVGVIEQMVAR